MTKRRVIIFIASVLLPLVTAHAATSRDKDSATYQAGAVTLIPQAGGYSNINNSTLKALMEQGVIVVDIRRKEEWRQTGILQGSKTITFFDQHGRVNPDFVTDFTAVVEPKDAVILICRTGNRTQAVSQAVAQQLGFQKVMNVTDGITAWIAENRPVSKYRD